MYINIQFNRSSCDFRQYKEALRQQRQQDVYRPRTDQSSPDLDSSPQTQSPVHFQKSQSSPHSPVANGYSSNTSPSFYNRTLSSNSSISSSTPNTSQVPNSPLLHSTPRRFQNTAQQNGSIVESKPEEIPNKRPVQKVVPSRNVNKYMSSNISNGNMDYPNGRVNGSQKMEGESYIKPTSPVKSPTSTLSFNSIGTNRNGSQSHREASTNGENAKLLTTTVSYLKGASAKPPGTGNRMSWNKEATSDKLSFTMKREFDKQKEESELLQQLRKVSRRRVQRFFPHFLKGNRVQ